MNPDWPKPRPEHLPQPSYAPPILAVGLMCLLWGVVTSWIISAVGLAVVAFASVQWIAKLRRGR